jgi:hypothetical protein
MMARRDVRVTPVGGHSSLSLDFPPCDKAKRKAARRRLWIQIKLEIVDQAAIDAGSHDLHVRLPSRSMNCKPLERLQGAASSITSSHPHFGRRGLDPSHVYQVNASSNVHFGS